MNKITFPLRQEKLWLFIDNYQLSLRCLIYKGFNRFDNQHAISIIHSI